MELGLGRKVEGYFASFPPRFYATLDHFSIRSLMNLWKKPHQTFHKLGKNYYYNLPLKNQYIRAQNIIKSDFGYST